MHRILPAFVVTFAFLTLTACDPNPPEDPDGDGGQTENVLLAEWTGPYGGVPAFDEMDLDALRPAMETAMAASLAEVEAIAADPEPPTFENTIPALERSGSDLERASVYFRIWGANLSTPEFREIQRELAPKLSKLMSDITQNQALFQRVKSVYESDELKHRDPSEQRLVQLIYDNFASNGATLEGAAKERYAEINQRLAELYTQFSNNLLADEEGYTLYLTEDQLGGLPGSFRAAAAAGAAENGEEGKYAIVNTRSSMEPFLTYSDDRALREKVWRNYVNRGDNGDEHDNNAIIAEILKLRDERVALQGYDNYAEWRLENLMAKTPERALELMETVWPAAIGRVQQEVADMQAIAAAEGAATQLEPWDYLHYAEKVRKAKYDLDQGQLKPYFELNNMVAAAMWSADRLYGVRFTEITGRVPVFHRDVRVFEVTDTATSAHRGLLYLDNFARAGKRSGAWASSCRTQHGLDGGVTSIETNNNNFVKAAPGEPILISLDDARTLFHEFGHALHGLLQDITYPGLADTPRDFVEFPSQVNERWLLTREVLDRFARHHQTGAPMPQALVDTIAHSERFNQGYGTVEYLAAAILDMDLHMRPGGDIDPALFEREALARIGMPREIALRHRLPHFDHLFGSDAYSAGYYSYLWSDVMATDAWQAFAESGGPWDRTMAERMRTHILSNGNTSDRAEAYRSFRGRAPDVKALFEHRGFPTTGD